MPLRPLPWPEPPPLLRLGHRGPAPRGSQLPSLPAPLDSPHRCPGGQLSTCRASLAVPPFTVPGAPVTRPWARFGGAETRTDPPSELPAEEEPGWQLGRLTRRPGSRPTGGFSPGSACPPCVAEQAPGQRWRSGEHPAGSVQEPRARVERNVRGREGAWARPVSLRTGQRAPHLCPPGPPASRPPVRPA